MKTPCLGPTCQAGVPRRAASTALAFVTTRIASSFRIRVFLEAISDAKRMCSSSYARAVTTPLRAILTPDRDRRTNAVTPHNSHISGLAIPRSPIFVPDPHRHDRCQDGSNCEPCLSFSALRRRQITLRDRVACALALAAICCAAASAQTVPPLPQDAYGFTLGKPLGLPECRRAAVGWETARSGACLRGILTSQPLNARQGIISFAPGEEPQHGNHLTYRLDDAGNLILLILSTAGPVSQDRVFADLIAKYGPPVKKGLQPLSSFMGARVDGVYAEWESPEVQVRFVGAVTSTSGQLQIGTPQGFAVQGDAMRRLSGSKRAL